MNLYKIFRAAVRRHSFIKEGDSVLVGVSGGVDSMTLAFLLMQLKKDLSFDFSLAHVNYQLRGLESEGQEKLVRDFARRHGLECFVTRAVLTKPGENFQSLAREFRYHYFAETARTIGANKIAVAHHKEDQVETIMANLLRGASLQGLRGMRAMREIQTSKSKLQNPILTRPLLEFSKKDLKKYATVHRIPFIEDSSNVSPQYWRNRLRAELLPVLENLRPRAFDKIVQLGKELGTLSEYLSQEALGWLQEFAKMENRTFWLPRPRLATLPNPLRLEVLSQAFLILSGPCQNLRRDHFLRCDGISLGSKGEAIYSLPKGLKFVRKGDDLFLKVC